MKATKPVWAVLITMVATVAQVFIGQVPVLLLMDQTNILFQPLGVLGVTATSILLAYLIRRFLGRQSWSGVRLTRSWSAVPHVLLGLLAGGIPIIAAKLLSIGLGVSDWVPWSAVTVAQVLAQLPLGIVVIVLGQAFPEELLWRGHLFDTLSSRLSPRTVLIVVSVGFGVLHIFSQSPADTLAERLLYVVNAGALGFVCAAARSRSGAVWAAVGAHTGAHLGMGLLPTQDLQYGVQLALMACTLTLAALAVLTLFRSNRATDQAGRSPA